MGNRLWVCEVVNHPCQLSLIMRLGVSWCLAGSQKLRSTLPNSEVLISQRHCRLSIQTQNSPLWSLCRIFSWHPIRSSYYKVS